MPDYFLIQFFEAFGVKEIGESLRVWRCRFNVLKIISSNLYFWDKGIFCYSSLDLLDFVDSVHMGCVQPFVGC